MAKFQQEKNGFVCKSAVLAFRNLVRNYDGPVTDPFFFEIVDASFDHDAAMALVEDSYCASELAGMRNARSLADRLDRARTLKNVFCVLWNSEGSRGKCREILKGICDYTIRDIGECDRTDPVRQRILSLKRAFGLSSLETAIMTVAYSFNESCLEWPDKCLDSQRPLCYAMALDRSLPEVSAALSRKGRLRRFGVLNESLAFNQEGLGAFMEGVESEAIERRFYEKKEIHDALPWEYYEPRLRKAGETARRILSAGGPCNILLYGEPGTGKTSYARSLARGLGRAVFEIRQGDRTGRNMCPGTRMAGIQMCNEQEPPESGIMVVDEADALLRSFDIDGRSCDADGRTTEKGEMNAILDEMKLPAVWISNAPAQSMDESVRRRFDYSVKFERLARSSRVSVWRNLVAKHGLQGWIDNGRISRYAEQYETSAGGISTVLANIGRIKPEQSEVDGLVSDLMASHCQLMGIDVVNRQGPAGDYSLAGLSIKGDIGLDKVVAAARNFRDAATPRGVDSPRMNILLWGPPGTGKTEFVRYLGRELDCPVLVKMGGDLLSKWVGGTERNIRAAFAEAESENAILFLDEMDGILQDRAMAERNWEVSQVNELLSGMERFRGILVGATNFMERLDAALLRRFTFKLQFDYLEGEGKRLFFERMFGVRLAECEARRLDAMRNLAPGDFRTVRQSLFYLGGDVSNEMRLDGLERESSLKKGEVCNIGFSNGKW